ncbi:hypothetical protein, partial [Klebsiella oxytoca]|uniref:hypothetical protein n=1 Tax=Klebsiella oxytoca TaxID=571 RepID=UPI0013D33964
PRRIDAGPYRARSQTIRATLAGLVDKIGHECEFSGIPQTADLDLPSVSEIDRALTEAEEAVAQAVVIDERMAELSAR